MPEISVVMPAFNAEKYIANAIDSIINQSYRDFELLIINDGSMDNTETIIKNYSDKRIKYIVNESNLGIVETLNKGIGLAKGKFIARMDSDDIALPTRLEKQLKKFYENKDLVLISSSVHCFGSVDKTCIALTGSDNLKCHLLEEMYFVHPAMMYRKSVIDKYNVRYLKDYQDAEDYKFVTELMTLGDFDNVEEVLLEYRCHENQITQIKQRHQKEIADKVRMDILVKIGCELTEEEKCLFLRASFDKDSLVELERIYNRIIIANKRSCILNPEVLERVLAQIIMEKYYVLRQNDNSISKMMLRSELLRSGRVLNWKRKVRILLGL